MVAGAPLIGSVLSEAGDRAIDEARVDRGERGMVQPVFGEAADLEILDQHVGIAGERAHLLPTLGAFQVDRERGLAAVAAVEIGGAAVGSEGRTPLPGVVAG